MIFSQSKGHTIIILRGGVGLVGQFLKKPAQQKMAEQKSCKQSFGENIEQELSAIKVLFLTLKISYSPPNQIMHTLRVRKKFTS